MGSQRLRAGLSPEKPRLQALGDQGDQGDQGS
ncbi:hypothetical protein Q427_27200 [Halomonas sp. BC04]|nr:hypothetical protein Q427_27200 [Halomonas sp. BC04]